mgnify:FL=1
MKKHCFTAALLLGLSLIGRAAAADYTDLSPHWAEDALRFAVQSDLIDGVSEYTFAADAPATRACLVQALYRMEHAPVSEAALSFEDITDDASYLAAVRWGVSNGIITGYSDTVFRPGTSLTREQFAVMLYRFAEHKKLDVSAQTELSAYADAAAVHPYAQTAMRWANAAGLITGTTAATLSPQGTVSRAQLATILQRFAPMVSYQHREDDAASQPQSWSDVAFTTSLGDVTRSETEQDFTEVHRAVRRYTDTQNCTVEMGHSAAVLDAPAHTAAQFTMTGSSGSVRWYDTAAGQWHQQPLTSGTLPGGMYFLRVGSADSIVVTPMTYAARSNGMIEYYPAKDGTLQITQTENGFTFSLRTAALAQNTYSDYLLLTSQQLLVDWTDAAQCSRWANYSFVGSNRWCYNGYYYTAPSAYYPFGENYFYSLPAAHIAGKMMNDTDQAASRVLGLAMLDLMREQQNEYGFIPSQAGSSWLKNSYNIDPGYYDTRFNTDFWLANLNAVQNFGVTGWLDKTRKYADFLTDFAEKYHFALGSGENEGWLVQDYWHPNGHGQPTHASLNHHAAEAVFLYRFADATGEDSFAALADRMVRGIEQSEALWYKSNGDLYYSYDPNGTCSGQDYPYLTYNDLLELQRLYAARHGQPNAVLTRLMQSKLRWMNANGVTGYNR